MSEKFDRPLIILVILSGEPQWRQEILSPSTSQCLHAINTEHCMHSTQVDPSDEFDKLLV